MATIATMKIAVKLTNWNAAACTKREDLVEVGHHAGGDVARELAVVVVHAELAQAGRTPAGGADRSRSG